MRVALALSVAVIGLAACSQSMETAVPVGSPASVSTERDEAGRASSSGRGRGQPARGPRKLNGVPPGHYPTAGECRVRGTRSTTGRSRRDVSAARCPQ